MMMLHVTLVVFLIVIIPTCSSVGLYQQCGGEGFKGSNTCDWPLACYRRTRWFSSCQTGCPGGDWECAKAGNSPSGTSGLAKAWAQCGGEGWNGPRGCQEYPCQWRSKWYAQCRPDCPSGWLCQVNGSGSTVQSTLATIATVPTSTKSTLPESESTTDDFGWLLSTPDSQSGNLLDLLIPTIDNLNETQPDWLDGDFDDDAFGRYIVEHMLGSAEHDTDLPSIDSVEELDLYDVLVDYMIEIAEEQDPGIMARFGATFQRGSVEDGIAAWIDMHELMTEISESPELSAVLLLDPRFAAELEPPSFMEDLRTNTRSMSRSMTVCNQPIPDLGKQYGTYGDGKTTTSKDLAKLLIHLNSGLSGLVTTGLVHATKNLYDLIRVESGKYVPKDLESRLGAFYATREYKPCTIGRAVHRAIGAIYLGFGSVGEEKIGRVFNDPAAKAFFSDSIWSSSNDCVAAIEHRYWSNVKNEDGMSFGGLLGAFVQPGDRSKIQQFFGKFGCSKKRARFLPANDATVMIQW